ncbi:DNA cytosine methyltransferase [Rhodococcus hoagii]|nr:DNA cytosine methyltransferase [Prescottella equi]NKZ84605.1 DNA cytosine methyltransferase [Prescottella equi]
MLTQPLAVLTVADFMAAGMPTPEVLELFAGPGGWSTGLRRAGFTGTALGVEYDKDACATAVAAGHHRLQADVSKLDPRIFGRVEGHICSPPCQGFSPAGKGRGRADAHLLLDALTRVTCGADLDAAIAELHDSMTDDRSLLALEPLRYALYTAPSWVAWEQVPAVLPIWEACAVVLRRFGYTVDTGILHAEQYGVPQTRKRAILVAHAPWIATPAQLPHPMRSRFHSTNPGKIDAGFPRWVSMAQALTWGMTERPYPTIAPGTGQGGTDAQALGGSGARATVQAEREAGRWIEKDWDDAPEHWDRPFRRLRVLAPAGTSSTMVDPRPLDYPAPTITGKGTAEFGVRTTRAPGPKSRDPQGKRVSIAEAAVLQSFPPDYPFQGNKTAQYRQVGDAVPPLLAAAVLGPVLAAAAKRPTLEVAA